MENYNEIKYLPKINNITLENMGVFLMTIKTLLGFSKIITISSFVENILIVASLFCFITIIIKNKYTFSQLTLFFVLGIITLYSCLKTGHNSIMITILCIFSMKDYPFNKFIKEMFKIEYILFTFILLTSTICSIFIPSVSIKQNVGGIIRYNFGFSHPNTFSVYLYGIILMWVWLNFEKIKMKNLFIILMIGLISYCFTRTRTSLINILILIILMAINIYGKKIIKKAIKLMSMTIFPLLSVICIFMVVKFKGGNSLITIIDNLLTNRIKLGAYAYEHSGITLLGQPINYYNKIQWVKEWGLNSFTFDNIYTYCFMNIGIVWIIIISILYYKLAKVSSSKIQIFIILWSLYGVTEVVGMNGFCCFPIFLIVLLFNKNNKEIVV